MDHLTILTLNRFNIVQQLQVERSFLFDYLLSKNVFDRDDYDLVRAEKTREQKAVKVLDIIETKGPEGFNHFKDALQLINPNLYEIITGEKATVRDSPILDGTDFQDSGEGLPRLIDQDILSNHLKRVTDDLRDITLRYNTLLKDDQHLRKILNQTNIEKNKLNNRLKALEMSLAETQAIASKTHLDANVTLLNRYEAMQQDTIGSKDFIIQLQMKLLQNQEKYEEKSRQLEEYTMKYKHLEDEFLKVNENYIFQRSETKKLSATLRTRTEEAKDCDHFKKECREKQFKVMELQSSLDDREKELDEIKNWTTALKQRYDTVLQERNEIVAKQHEATENLSISQNNVSDMEIKVKRLNREIMELKRERDRLEGETTMLKGQVKAEHNAYIKATEKNEELKVYFNELLESKEIELSNNKEFSEYLQKEVEDLKRELSADKKELSALRDMNDSLSCDLRQLKKQYNTAVESLDQQISEQEKIESEDNRPNTSQDEIEDGEDQLDGKAATHDRTRRQSTAELLKSIKRRFKSGPSQTLFSQEKSKQLNKSRSVDAGRSSTLRTLPYEALSSIYTNDSHDADLAKSSLHYARKTSSPFPLSSCTPLSTLYLQSIVHESFKDGDTMDDKKLDCIIKESSQTTDDRREATFRPRSHVLRVHPDIRGNSKKTLESVKSCSPK